MSFLEYKFYACACGESGVKLWRALMTSADRRLLCAACLRDETSLSYEIEEDGSGVGEFGRTDAHGDRYPAVPTRRGESETAEYFWPYTQVPEDLAAEWRAAPLRKYSPTLGSCSPPSVADKVTRMICRGLTESELVELHEFLDGDSEDVLFWRLSELLAQKRPDLFVKTDASGFVVAE